MASHAAYGSVGSLPPSEQPRPLGSGAGGKPKNGFEAKTNVNVWELIFFPWSLLVLVLGCYLLAGADGQTGVIWLIPVTLLFLTAMFVRWHYKAHNNADVVLGLLCGTAIVIALFVGIYAEYHSLIEYARLDKGASYFNVLPSEAAAGKNDAVILGFDNSTGVDTHKVFGYVDPQTSAMHTYCVSPIGSGDAGTGERVQFFAAGVDCCEMHSNFQCGEVGDPEAHGGITLPQALQSAPGFASAIAAFEVEYGMRAAEGYLLVSWHPDPVGYKESLWSNTVTLFLVFGGVYLAISIMMGIALMPMLAGASSHNK